MKVPVPLPFVHRGEDLPPTGVTLQAVLGFILPFIVIALAAVITYFIIHAKLNQGGSEGAGALLALLDL